MSMAIARAPHAAGEAPRDAAPPVGPNSVHLTLEALEKRYGNLPPSVTALSLQLRQGELLGLLGPSGCGKTTTLRMISGLVPATAGRILVGGRDVTALPPYRRDMGVVFQAYALFPHMTVAENVAFGLEMRKISRSEARERVMRALGMVRLEALADRKPRELSGGQQQRVALARALVIEPSILLLDEPLSNLDAKLRDEMRNEIRDIQQRLGITAVFVTHDQVEAMAICDRIGVMRAGRLEQIATPLEVYERPATPFVADFVGRMNHLRGTRLDGGGVRVGEAVLATAGTGPAGEALLLMVRPHRIRMTPAAAGRPEAAGQNVQPGTVRRVTFVGDALHYEVTMGAETMLVENSTVSGPQSFALGDAVFLSWNPDDTLTFPAGTEA
jgi:putative spermidine/putrescine transport system ATP-binding protein